MPPAEPQARAQSGKRLGSYGAGRSVQHSLIPGLIQNIMCNALKLGRLTSCRVCRSKRDSIAHASEIHVHVKLPRLDTVCENNARKSLSQLCLRLRAAVSVKQHNANCVGWYSNFPNCFVQISNRRACRRTRHDVCTLPWKLKRRLPAPMLRDF